MIRKVSFLYRIFFAAAIASLFNASAFTLPPSPSQIGSKDPSVHPNAVTSSTTYSMFLPLMKVVSYNEARVRYIIADSQLGSVIDYYRQHLDDVNAFEAVQWWDAGFRVLNIDEFERKVVEPLGWQVVYKGTDTTIDGMDVILVNLINEARVRYILADSQLGSVIGYYRYHLDDANAAEAVRRWDAGVRVANIDQFERKIVDPIGWQVVYKGTDITIDGMDVILTTIDLLLDEARVRYIIADIQLGGPLGYYLGYLDDTNVAEAVSRWYDGVRVANIDQFERKIIDPIGWQIVYAGTEITIDGMDVILTSDP